MSDPITPLPLLITGVAGVAGYSAFHYFRRKYHGQVIGIRRKDNWPLRGEGIVPCDGDNRDELARLFDKHQFAAVLNCEGTCKLKSCEMDPRMAQRVNIDSVTAMLDVIGTASTRLVHLSIDLVFSGTRGGGHVEHDETDPVTVYGKTMAEAERILLGKPNKALTSGQGDSPTNVTIPRIAIGNSPNTPTTGRGFGATILRISLPMGISFNGHAGAIDWIGHRFKKGKPATLYYDEIRTPTYTDCLNPLLANVLARPEMTGLYHAGGPRRLSLFEIAQIVSRIGGYDPHLLHGCPRIDAGPVPPRAGDVTLDSSKLSLALGYDPFDPWPLADEHVPTHRAWHFEGPRGSPELLAEVLYRNPGRPASDPNPKR
jgi:dTDP-4-dehydrorhamnose reductase